MPDKKNEPNIWVTVIKLVIGLIVIIWGTGAVLNYFARNFTPDAPKSGTSDWGIARDSPIPSKR
jgi:hypothetical protein